MEQHATPAGEEELVLALAAGATVREAAERAGIEERTVYRRLADAEFRRAVGEVRDRMFDSARGRLAGLTGKATETLARLLESDQPSEALGAAKAILELGPRLCKASQAEERLCRSEDEADERNGKQTTAADEELVQALAAGAPGARTAHRRLADADFRRVVSRARGRIFDAALGRLAGLAGEATDVFERLLVSDQPSVARRAAKAILQLGPRLRDATELEERRCRLEDQADEKADEQLTAVIIDNGRYGQ
jgi:hypothetical protein